MEIESRGSKKLPVDRAVEKDVEGRKKVGRENMRKVTFYLRLVILTRDQNSVRELQENI